MSIVERRLRRMADSWLDIEYAECNALCEDGSTPEFEDWFELCDTTIEYTEWQSGSNVYATLEVYQFGEKMLTITETIAC